MKYKHIFWDWNGTLLDDIWLSAKVVSAMLQARNLPKISVDDYKNRFGFPLLDFYTEMGFDFNKETFEGIGDEYIASYNAQRHLCQLHDGAYSLIEKLHKMGVGQSIVSAYQEDFLRDVVREKGLDKFMYSIIGLDNIYALSKVEIAKKHFLNLGIKANELLFVGDTQHDSHAAEEIGCDCIFVSHGHSSHSRLKSLNTHKVLNTHKDLADYLEL
ncbi:MAG: HAD family hydrolase [Opitutales bacterium]